MSEQRHTTEPSQPRVAPARRRFLAGMLTGGLLGSLLAGGIHTYSQAHGPGGWFRGGHGSSGWFRQGGYDPAQAGARAGFATDWLLHRVGASDTQRQQAQAIVQATLADLAPLRSQHQQHRQQLLDILQQPSIDREALGDVRLAELQLAETFSERLLTALADLAEVLTPEQRSTLMTHLQQWHQ